VGKEREGTIHTYRTISPNDKLFNEAPREIFDIIFVQFWYTREKNVQHRRRLYIYVHLDYYKFFDIIIEL